MPWLVLQLLKGKRICSCPNKNYIIRGFNHIKSMLLQNSQTYWVGIVPCGFHEKCPVSGMNGMRLYRYCLSRILTQQISLDVVGCIT